MCIKYDKECLVPDYKLNNPQYIVIKGINYYRFSGKIDKVHLQKGGSLCGKPSLSSNYSEYKPMDEEFICEACLDKAYVRTQKRL